MTQQQALEAAQQMFPKLAEFIAVSRERRIGAKFAHENTFHIWNHEDRKAEILGSSHISWEQALDEAKSKTDSAYTEDHSTFDDEVTA